MIRGKRISLHPIARRHLKQTRRWANDPELGRLMDRARPVSELEHERWFADVLRRDDCAYFAIQTNTRTRHVGNVWLWAIDWRHRKAEIRIVIGDAGQKNRGLGTEAIQLLCAHAFVRLNLHKVYAYVLATNPRARRSFEKAGFELEGTLKADRWIGDRYANVFLLARFNSVT